MNTKKQPALISRLRPFSSRLRTLARIFHELRSRRREEADGARAAGNPPPHVGGYSLSAFRGRCEISGLGLVPDGSARGHVCARSFANAPRGCGRAILSVPALLLLLSALEDRALAQGCVQSRGAGTCVLMPGVDLYLQPGQWQGAVGYRWLHADRVFIGSQEQPQRQAAGNQDINTQHFIDLTVSYGVTKRLSLNLTLPFVDSTRSSVFEHDRVNRYSMHASGLADVRLTSTVWLFAPETHHDGNLSLGVGFKAPTGDYEATDIAHRPAGPVLAYVDQSIQPGDGGWGVVLETQGFQKLFENAYAYMNASYLINPQEKHPAPPISTGYSIPDAYLLRAGFSYSIWPSKGLSLSVGGRMEGVPATDWFGGSTGFRRPGYAISIEPGITWVYGKLALTVTAPVAIARNREKSVAELANGRHGEASFADYIITSSISYRF